jgi:3-hydroxyisobutyrate dehydrogenase-like beta-hydroxyacid dehydrogenase
METIGFIGLGSQGGPMAQRIADAGMPLVLWARRPEALAGFKGAETADSLASLGARCDHVGICVVDDAGVVDVCSQLIAAMKPGSRIAIHSTILPETCKALAEQAAARGIALIDAPVSGGGPAAAEGKLTVMVGGSADAVEASRAVFETFASMIVHLGQVGAGQMAKLVNNTLMTANMGLAHHALASGEALGIDRSALVDLIKASSGRSFGFEVYARLPSPSAFAHGGALLAKDVGLLNALTGPNPHVEALSTTAHAFLDLIEIPSKEQPQ